MLLKRSPGIPPDMLCFLPIFNQFNHGMSELVRLITNQDRLTLSK